MVIKESDIVVEQSSAEIVEHGYHQRVMVTED
jgi:hypothetical protein